MDRGEIDQYLSVSLGNSVMVHVAPVAGFEGLLRTVLLHADNTVTVEFINCSVFRDDPSEQGPLKYIGRYPPLDEALADLQVYLGAPMTEWRNYSRIAYDFKDCIEPDFEAQLKKLEEAVLAGTLHAPSKGHWQVADHYWKHIKSFGKFRPEMMGTESEFYFHE